MNLLYPETTAKQRLEISNLLEPGLCYLESAETLLDHLLSDVLSSEDETKELFRLGWYDQIYRMLRLVDNTLCDCIDQFGLLCADSQITANYVATFEKISNAAKVHHLRDQIDDCYRMLKPKDRDAIDAAVHHAFSEDDEQAIKILEDILNKMEVQDD